MHQFEIARHVHSFLNSLPPTFLSQRLLHNFSKRGPVPDHRPNSAELTIGIAVSGKDFGLARHIGQCINNILKIEWVLVPEKPYADLSWAAKLV